nr:SDR family NAD(P)-dependent oxidoreductase [Gammaproteobacteria bacterium]
LREAVSSLPDGVAPDWVMVATGWLHDRAHSPEKTFRALDAEHLMQAYRVNAVGPALLIKHLLPRMDLSRLCRIGVLSARVGSISDNRLGGWHAYRASKAALNMLIRNYAIELARKSDRLVIVGLQPGTTDTRLSAPFQRHVPPGQLQSPQFTATHLVEVMTRLVPADSGGLFDFLGLPFDP